MAKTAENKLLIYQEYEQMGQSLMFKMHKRDTPYK